MAVGTSDHKVQIWDVEKLKQVRTMDGHRARVSSLSWNGPLLSSGGRDSLIVNHDVREQRHRVGTLRGHTQEVCGLRWSPSGTQLASGGNDNLLNIWDDRYLQAANMVCDTPVHRLDAHQAAVKALAWCPWQKNLLASGGGTADRMIRFWNSNSGSCLNEVDTHSQVRGLGDGSARERGLMNSAEGMRVSVGPLRRVHAGTAPHRPPRPTRLDEASTCVHVHVHVHLCACA